MVLPPVPMAKDGNPTSTGGAVGLTSQPPVENLASASVLEDRLRHVPLLVTGAVPRGVHLPRQVRRRVDSMQVVSRVVSSARVESPTIVSSA